MWLPFLVAFAVATLTAYSYLELVTKYPQAAGAALYTHKAFGSPLRDLPGRLRGDLLRASPAPRPRRTCSPRTCSRGFDVNGIDVPQGNTAITLTALAFMLLLALINLRGVGESVKFNVVLTLVEMTRPGHRDRHRLLRDGAGRRGPRPDRGLRPRAQDRGIFLAVTVATAIAFFAMVGFEDSVNMVEETENPERVFPRIMLTGLGIAVIFYVLVAISVDRRRSPRARSRPSSARRARSCSRWSRRGAPDIPIDKIFPFLTVFAVANTALINMLMASRLLYGLANQDVLPRTLGRVLPGRRTPWAGIASRRCWRSA